MSISFPIYTIAFTGLFYLYAGLLTIRGFSKDNKDLPWKEAKYLDDKIKELY